MIRTDLPADTDTASAQFLADLNDRLRQLADGIDKVQATAAAAAAGGKGPFTVTLAKITGGGTNGTLAWDKDGKIVRWLAPT